MPQPECIVNPKTGKLYTRHSYTQEGLRVTTYYPQGAPASYAFELVCKRCGYQQTVRY